MQIHSNVKIRFALRNSNGDTFPITLEKGINELTQTQMNYLEKSDYFKTLIEKQLLMLVGDLEATRRGMESATLSKKERKKLARETATTGEDGASVDENSTEPEHGEE